MILVESKVVLTPSNTTSVALNIYRNDFWNTHSLVIQLVGYNNTYSESLRGSLPLLKHVVKTFGPTDAVDFLQRISNKKIGYNG